jgi:hypothetical protein
MAELRNPIERNGTSQDINFMRCAYQSLRDDVMTDQELTLQAVSTVHRILEEYLEPRPHNPERVL